MKQPAYLLRGAFYALLLLAVCMIPFALGQRHVSGSSSDENSAGTDSAPHLPAASSESGDEAMGPMQVPPRVLWSQYDNAATQPPLGIGSQKFEMANDALSDQAADDFFLNIESGIVTVNVMGEYSPGGGPAAAFNVYFYANGAGNKPGALLGALTNRPYSGTPPDFSINLNLGPNGFPFGTSGHYWVSVQAVQDSSSNGQWFWHNRTSQRQDGAVWQNPGGGYGTGCVAWNQKNACMPDQVWPDQVFSLIGQTFPTPTATATATPTATATSSPRPTATATATFTPRATATATVTAAPTPTPPPTPTPTATPAITALGNYPDTSIPLSGNTTVIPDAIPINTTSINVSTNTNFNGTFAASPITGRLIVTDAHPAGNYTVTVKAFGPGGTATKTFTLAVNGGAPCAPNSTDGFINAPDVPVGDSPISVAIGDFNGDGKQDFAVADLSTDPGTVSIRLGNGMGGFPNSAEVTVVEDPTAIAIGDFNGDGKQDFVVVGGNGPSYSASVRLGDGRGGFTGSTTISVGSSPASVAVGDFNGDGKQDFAVANFGSNTVSIRLGDGLGGFVSAPDVSVTHEPNSIAIGDFNGDGKQDLAAANWGQPGTVSIRLGDGLGGFTGSTDVSAGSVASSVAIGDFDEDGKQDLAIANYGSNSVSIRFGNGLGGFGGSTEVSVGTYALIVVIGDFNRDGHQDLAVGGGLVSIRLGDGLGGFSTFQNVPAGFQPFSIAIGDFNGDARQDLAVANAEIGQPVSIRLGTCNAPVIVFVTTTNDSGPGSLRQALADAHDQTTIQFDPALNGQTINLTSGELLVGANITITGPGPGLLTVAGNLTNFRVFHILSGHTVAISGLTIRNGQAPNGAGIFNSGTLTVTNCVVTSNRADFSGAETMPTFATGAGIYNEGTLILLNTTVSGNQTGLAPTSGGGGITNIATLTITQSAINSNFSYYAGGGILNSGMLTINNSAINNNHAEPLGHNSGNGGGINNGGTAIIQNSTVSGNSVNGDGTGGQGGGIANYGSLDVINSTINGNTAIYGGGVYFYGGGHVTNSTISSNTVQFNGGGIWGGVIVSNSTISGNSSNSQGGGIYATRGPVELGNTILKAGSSGATIFNNGSGVTSHGYNISSDNGGGLLNGPGDQINTDPMLGPLQNNGGPTLTHALLPGSQAIDTGDPNFTPPPFTDQRGFPRVANGRIDKGSFEVQPTPTPTPCVVLHDQSNNAGGGGVVSQNFETSNDIYDAQAADDFVVPSMQNWTVQQVKVNGVYFGGPGPAASVNLTFYFGSGGFPGPVVSGGTFNNLSMSDTSGSFTIPLPTNLILSAGTYWVSVQANIDFNPFGQWAWSDRMTASNSAAVWQNPGGGLTTSCLTYGRRGANCEIDPTAPDQVFQILGCLVLTTPVSISGNVSYCSNPIPGPVPNVTFTLTGNASGLSSSDPSGNYQFAVPSGGSYTVTPAKAALAPGSPGINTVDVITVQRHFLNIGTPLSGCRLIAADVNGDASIDTIDVIAIQRFYLILPTGTASVGHYKFVPVNRTYQTISTNQTAQNYDALVFGDVAAPFAE